VNSIFNFREHVKVTNQLWTDLSERESHDNNVPCLYYHLTSIKKLKVYPINTLASKYGNQ